MTQRVTEMMRVRRRQLWWSSRGDWHVVGQVSKSEARGGEEAQDHKDERAERESDHPGEKSITWSSRSKFLRFAGEAVHWQGDRLARGVTETCADGAEVRRSCSDTALHGVPATRIISVSKCGWHQNGWNEAEYGSYVEGIHDKCGYWRTHIISGPCVLGMHSVNATKISAGAT